MKQAAALLLYRPDDGRVLVAKRSASAASNPDVWAFPGGKVEPGEKAMDAAVREFQEEMGSLPEIRVYRDPDISYPAPGFRLLTFYGAMLPLQDWEPVLDFEHSAYEWALPAELPEPLLPASRKAVRRFLQ